MAGLTGVLEDDVQSICLSLIGKPPEDMERAAANVIVLARQGADERRALAEEGVIHSLTIMCSREFNAKTQAKGALALAALCSNYSTNLDDTKMYVYSAAQHEALQRGAVICPSAQCSHSACSRIAAACASSCRVRATADLAKR